MTDSSSPNSDTRKSAALQWLLVQPVDGHLISYVIKSTWIVWRCPPFFTARSPQLLSLQRFITSVIITSGASNATLMGALVYLRRLKKSAPLGSLARPFTHRHIFLSSLILASKYLHDCSPKNKHWAMYSDFSNEEVNATETQLLSHLQWALGMSKDDIDLEFDMFCEDIRKSFCPLSLLLLAQR